MKLLIPLLFIASVANAQFATNTDFYRRNQEICDSINARLTPQQATSKVFMHRKTGTDSVFAATVVTPGDTSLSYRFVINSAPPTNTAQLANGAGYLTTVPAQTFTSLISKPSTLAGYGIIDAITDENYRLALAPLGSLFLAESVGQTLAVSNTSTALVDGQIKFTAIYLPKAATLTGIKVYVRTLGSYTGDNNNRVGLYTYSAGVLTLVASSANSAALWTSAANAFQTIAFSSTYSASAGLYFVGILYNQSAVVTAPALASGVAINNIAMASLGFTNSAKLYGTANGNDLTTPINMTAITASLIPSWVALY